MIVVMCGLPKSGKSAIVDYLFDEDEHYITRPSDYIPENIENVPAEIRRRVHVEAWNTGIELARKQVHEGSSEDVLVLDMCNKNFSTFSRMLRFAKKQGHKIIMLYVNSSVSECKARSDGSLDDSIFASYVDSLKNSLPKYKKECDEFIVVNNKGDLPELHESLSSVRDKLCLNTSTPTHTT